MDIDLISIVVPIYKVEEYLDENIKSLLNQTYKNLEIILVDDGSPDNCGKICDEYASKDSRIKVIHKKNGGLSDARNHGINIATGKYIVFVDSDDYLDTRYIELLYNAIKVDNAKVSQCGVLIVNDEKEILNKHGYLNNQTKSGREMLKDLYYDHGLENVVVWNKMYSIELFKDIRYPVGKIHEDEFITYKIIYNLERIAIVNEYLYNYRQNENSIIGKKYNIKRLDVIEAFEEKVIFFKEKEEIELYQLAVMSYLWQIREAYMNTRKHISDSKHIQKELIRKYRNNFKVFLKNTNQNIIKKMKMLIFYISPDLFYYIKK